MVYVCVQLDLSHLNQWSLQICWIFVNVSNGYDNLTILIQATNCGRQIILTVLAQAMGCEGGDHLGNGQVLSQSHCAPIHR